MKMKLVISNEELEQIVLDHINSNGFDTFNKEVEIDFVVENEGTTVVVDIGNVVVTLQGEPKQKRTRRSKEQILEDERNNAPFALQETNPTPEPTPVDEEDDEDIELNSNAFAAQDDEEADNTEDKEEPSDSTSIFN